MTLICFFVVLCASFASSQNKKFKSSKSQSDLTSLIEAARINQTKDPSKSISYLDQVIVRAKQENENNVLIEAYSLLGEINRNTGLPELAVKRYEQALSYALPIGDNKIIVPILQEKGNLQNSLNNIAAIKTFQDCLNFSDSATWTDNCSEGLGLAYFKAGENELARTIFKNLEQNQYKENPIALSRIQAYLSQIDAKSEDLVAAKMNYSKSRENFRRGRGQESDYVVIDSALSVFRQNSGSVDDEIQVLTENIQKEKAPSVIQAKDQLQLADAYIKKGDLVNASNTIEEARTQIKETKDVNLKAKIFKKSSEIFAKQGQYAQALENYKAFEKQQREIIQNKESELQKKLNLLEDQNAIDISENIYSSEQKLGLSEKRASNFQKYIIWLLLALLLTAIFAAWWISRSLKAQSIANKQLELKSLRGQMNPHFIFNALNSVNEFIATQNPRKANAYLSQFSKLMRSVLDVNKKDLIPISEEIALTKNYLELEHARFNDKFDFTFEVESAIYDADILVPPLLLQPYIENAIWHGLRYLDYKGQLDVSVKHSNQEIEILISDNGIGRKKSQLNKTKHQKIHKSTGMKNTADRIQILKSLYGKQYDVKVNDLYSDQENTGTLVVIKIFDQ